MRTLEEHLSSIRERVIDPLVLKKALDTAKELATRNSDEEPNQTIQTQTTPQKIILETITGHDGGEYGPITTGIVEHMIATRKKFKVTDLLIDNLFDDTALTEKLKIVKRVETDRSNVRLSALRLVTATVALPYLHELPGDEKYQLTAEAYAFRNGEHGGQLFDKTLDEVGAAYLATYLTNDLFDEKKWK